MALSPCRKCGRLLSWEEYVCPHCGTRDPIKHAWSERTDAPDEPPVLGLLAGCVILVIAGLGALILLSWLSTLFGGGTP